MPLWCHGATGIGQFFLHGQETGLVSGAAEVTERAALATGLGARAAGPSQCHGLAGNIEFLLDVYQASGDARHLSHARSLAHLLEGFALMRKGRVSWCSEVPDLVTPDYMVGYSGVAMTLLRLADPQQRPRQLTVAGFRLDGTAS
jgi:lantibiotic modifying enzyme